MWSTNSFGEESHFLWHLASWCAVSHGVPRPSATKYLTGLKVRQEVEDLSCLPLASSFSLHRSFLRPVQVLLYLLVHGPAGFTGVPQGVWPGKSQLRLHGAGSACTSVEIQPLRCSALLLCSSAKENGWACLTSGSDLANEDGHHPQPAYTF